MADVTWSAYALAMFTEEQRAAAVNAAYEPPETSRPIPPAPPTTVNVPTLRVAGLNPNDPKDLGKLYEMGWRFEAGQWYQLTPGNPGTPADPDGLRGRVGLSSVQGASSVGGGAVLGYTVPMAPPVLLPSYVGGRIGQVVIGAGTRPTVIGQSQDERIVLGTGWRVVID